jgi:hypothetical protein
MERHHTRVGRARRIFPGNALVRVLFRDDCIPLLLWSAIIAAPRYEGFNQVVIRVHPGYH